MAKATVEKVVALRSDQVTNAGQTAVEFSLPYTVAVEIQGTVPIIFHRWNCDAVEEKAKAAKGSKAKKTDDIESYLYRNKQGKICLPGEYLRQSVINAAKYKQDPRSPRKSAMDLFTAGIISLTELASLNAVDPDFLDRRRVMVQRQGITRVRPAMNVGWKVTIDLLINLPEYINATLLRQVVDDAGRLIGVGNFRPTFGRFAVSRWTIKEA